MIDQFEGEFRFLSNFWPAEVALDDETYSTVEHAYQAAKTLDSAERRMIRLIETPGEAKRAGRKITLRQDWEAVKLQTMFDLLKQKFAKDELRMLLLATEDRMLVEGNTWGDVFWGVDLRTGEGKNNLGKLLMVLRRMIKFEKVHSVDEPLFARWLVEETLTRRIREHRALSAEIQQLVRDLASSKKF